MALFTIFILYCVAHFTTAMPSMYSRKWENFTPEKIRYVTNSTLQGKDLEYNHYIMSNYTAKNISLFTSNYVISKFKAIYSTNNLKLSTLTSTRNVPSSSTRSVTTSGDNKQNTANIALITVVTVFGGLYWCIFVVLLLYLLYLSLLLIAEFWKYLFRTFNCYTYGKMIE